MDDTQACLNCDDQRIVNGTDNKTLRREVTNKPSAKEEDTDATFEEKIAFSVAIGCGTLVFLTYFGLMARAIYQAVYCEKGGSEIDIFSDEFIERQKRIFEIEEKNQNAKISMATLNQIEYDNHANPLTLPEMIRTLHKKLREVIALEDTENQRRNALGRPKEHQ